MGGDATLADAEQLLGKAGYDNNLFLREFPVWVSDPSEVVSANLVAFERPVPMDMSTALVVVQLSGTDHAHRIACTLGVPYVFTPNSSGFYLSIADSDRLRFWEEVDSESFHRVERWLRPEVATQVKAGLRQLPLFDVPVDFLANAKAKGSERLGPIVGEALRSASEALTDADLRTQATPTRAHYGAARLVIGALTALVIRDTESPSGGTTARLLPSASEVVARAVQRHPETFDWFRTSTATEKQVLIRLVDQLGRGIDYRSMDPAILSLVYEQALVAEDDRRRLGIHYTPPELAARLLDSLPVETIDPKDRFVFDPACGSGSLLVAAHDRLHKLQPPNWSLDEQHRDLRVHLRGQDIDHFAAGIARLALLLKAQPAGNGWSIDAGNTLDSDNLPVTPRIIVMNPPWKLTTEEHKRQQKADDFMRWAADELAPGGLLGAIVPTSWLSAGNSKATRERICSEFEVFEVWRLPGGTFSTSSQPSSVLLARKKEAADAAGKRIVRQVWKPELKPFFAGQPPLASFVVGNSTAALSRTLPQLEPGNSVCRLQDVAIVLSGQQRLPNISDRGEGDLYLAEFSRVAPYGAVEEAALWRLRFPEDFQSARGASVKDKQKVLVSAARNANNPWRFRVALDRHGVACTNGIRCVAPIDQQDTVLLYALLAILGSGFASAYAACAGIDRNIPAGLMRDLPVPMSRRSIRVLGELGRQASNLAGDVSSLNAVLSKIERAVWEAYAVSGDFRDKAARLLSGHPAPDGSVRYRVGAHPAVPDKAAMRRVGAVLDVEGELVRIWINGVTPDDGVLLEVPPRMPGWLLRPGATFEARGIEAQDDIGNAIFEFQPMAWRTFDLDGPAGDR